MSTSYAATPALSLSLEDARALGAQALTQNRPDIARSIGMALLKADPEDAFAYALLTRAHLQLGNPKLARAGARLAYRYTQDPANKFAAAHTAAQLAASDNRAVAAHYWLRRAAAHAESPQNDAVLKRSFQALRTHSPWKLNLRGSLTPSNNVNNGSDSTENIVNGVPSFAFISGSSRALSGWIGTLDVHLQYRLHQTVRNRTQASGRVYTRQVSLSSDAKAQAPGVTNDDYGATYVDVALDHALALGAEGNTAGVQLSLGTLWSAGDPSYDFARLALRRSVKLSQRDRLSFNIAREWRNTATPTGQDANLLRMGAQYRHKLERGDALSVSLDAQDVAGGIANATYQSWSARLGYQFGRQIGPAQVSTSLSFGRTDYDAYAAPLPVPGGRQDTTITGMVSLFFPDHDVAGFAPSLDIKARKRRSNISLYEASEVSLGLGIRSKF